MNYPLLAYWKRRVLHAGTIGATLVAAALLTACVGDELDEPDLGEADSELTEFTFGSVPGEIYFGGAYGWVNRQPVVNPYTGAQTCPTGYSDIKLLGTYNVDYEVHMCMRPRSNLTEPVADLGGMWGYVDGKLRVNPATGAASCPDGYADQTVLGSYNIDWPLHICHKPHAFRTQATYRFGGAWGYINGGTLTANPTTGAASCPDGFVTMNLLGTRNVDWSLGACMLFWGVNTLDFGGAYGAVNGVLQNNPATNARSCPPGYSPTGVLGSYNVDWPLTVCTRPSDGTTETFYDWGGMWGYVNGRPVANWLSGKPGCPPGYTDQHVLGTINTDWDLHVCYRPHVAGTQTEHEFGGLWGAVDRTTTANPVTGLPSCPRDFTPQQVFGASGTDYPIYQCVPARSPCDTYGTVCTDSLAQRYAPYVWLHPGDVYMPSSVETFLANTHQEPPGDVTNPNAYLVTNQALGCDSCTDPAFLDGVSPWQADVPVYAEVVNRTDNGAPTNVTDVIYWMFYPYNNGKRVCIGVYTSFGCIGGYSTFGNHVGDWESVTIRFVDGQPSQVALSQHSGDQVFDYHDPALQFIEGRLVVYAAKGSHGLYHDAARHIYRRLGNGDFLADDTAAGTLWRTGNRVVEFDPTAAPFTGALSWLNFAGRWGNRKSGCGLVEMIADECVLNDGPRAILPRAVSDPQLRPL